MVLKPTSFFDGKHIVPVMQVEFNRYKSSTVDKVKEIGKVELDHYYIAAEDAMLRGNQRRLTPSQAVSRMIL